MIFSGAGQPHRRDESNQQLFLNEGEILVAISMATICGSDLHTFEGRRSAPTPCVLGHEGVGTVEAVGAQVDPALIGQRVTWTLVDSCGCCMPCTDWDLPQKCESLFKYGHAPLDEGAGFNGCFSSHIVLRPGTTVVALPDSLPDSFVAPANCALATMMAVLDKVPADAKRVLIQGAGLLGVYGVALLRDRGVETVFVSDPVRERLDLVNKFGGAAVQSDGVRILEGQQVDAVIEVAGEPEVVQDGLRVLRPGGTYIFAGMVHEDTALDILGVDIVKGCVSLIGVHNYAGRHLVEAVKFLERTANRFPWGELVSPPMPLADLDQAFAISQERTWHRVSVVPD